MLVGLGCHETPEPCGESRLLMLEEVDGGALSAAHQAELQVSLGVEGACLVTVDDASVEDPSVWEVDPAWKETALVLDPAAADGSSTAVLGVWFTPPDADSYSTTLHVDALDSEGRVTTADTTLRATAAWPCAEAVPRVVEFGTGEVGATYSATFVIENCGEVDLHLSECTLEGSATFSMVSDPPAILLPGDATAMDVEWAPSSPGMDEAMVSCETDTSDATTQATLVGESE